ncbi:MAG: hypothetical protein JWL76_2155 [Thermoleophilia bacterium]|nr:hypothetical protein [Thermoleophilia bacterium]
MVSGTSPLRAAATVIDRAAGSLRAAIDHKLPVLFNRSAVFQARGTHAQTAMRQAEEAVALLREAGPRGETLATSMQSDLEYLHRVFDGRPFEEARHSLSGGYEVGKLQLRADRARMLDELAALDDTSARGLLEARLEGPLRRMTAGDLDASREVALLAGMPEGIRPRHMATRIQPSVWDAIGASRDKHVSLMGSASAIEASAALRRYELAALPPATIEAKVSSLLARDADSLTPNDVRELAIVATLPGHAFPALGVPSLRRSTVMDALLRAEPSLTDGNPNLLMQDTFLREIDALRLVREGTAPTRREAILEMAAILDTPLDELTPQQLRRMSVLNHLPIEHRPTAPTLPSTLQLWQLGLRTGWKEPADRKLRMLEDARAHFHDLRDPGVGLRQLRAALEADQPFDVHRMAALLSDRDATRAAGIDDAMVARAVTRQLQGAGTPGMKGAPLQQIMEGVRATLAARSLRPEFEQVRTATLELIDRNLERMSGVRTDTFGRHPDYAEVGRVAAQLQLLDTVDRRTATAAATASVSSARETLTW